MRHQLQANVGEAAAIGITTLLFYAVPDFLKTRPARAIAKTAVLAASTAAMTRHTLSSYRHNADEANWLDLDADTDTEPTSPIGATDSTFAEPKSTDGPSLKKTLQERPGLAVAGALGLGATGISVTVIGEKMVYHFAEWRKRRGARFAHTQHAAVIGLASAAFAFATSTIDDGLNSRI